MRGLGMGGGLGKGFGKALGGGGLGKLVADLSRQRKAFEAAMKAGGLPTGVPGRRAPSKPTRLKEITGFGSNPGNLRMFAYVPEHLPPSPAMVVVLHGCTQTAGGYEMGAGWSTLAERYGFVLVSPEQQAANNPKTCFSWFQPEDTTRDKGEALSIRQMVERAAVDHGVDRKRIFVTGLSAGGAMTSVMLADYPEVFAGGAIIAGLPYGAANSVPEAFESMFQGKSRPAREWGDLVRKASPHKGPWPRISVWHGTADATVKASNAGEILKQWTDVHGLSLDPTEDKTVDGIPRKVWRGRDGSELIEEYSIPGMAHGTPLAIKGAENALGEAGPFMLDVGIASSYHIAKFWGLAQYTRSDEKPVKPAASVISLPDGSNGRATPREPVETTPEASAARTAEPRRVKLEFEEQPAQDRLDKEQPAKGQAAKEQAEQDAHAAQPKVAKTVNDIITRALKAAGLMKT